MELQTRRICDDAAQCYEAIRLVVRCRQTGSPDSFVGKTVLDKPIGTLFSTMPLLGPHIHGHPETFYRASYRALNKRAGLILYHPTFVNRTSDSALYEIQREIEDNIQGNPRKCQEPQGPGPTSFGQRPDCFLFSIVLFSYSFFLGGQRPDCIVKLDGGLLDLSVCLRMSAGS